MLTIQHPRIDTDYKCMNVLSMTAVKQENLIRIGKEFTIVTNRVAKFIHKEIKP